MTALTFSIASSVIGHSGTLVEVTIVAGLIALPASWILGGFAKRAVICRTFHSREVEDVLITRILGQVSWFCKVVLIENKRFPDFERRYDVAALSGIVVVAAVLFCLSWLLNDAPFLWAALALVITVAAVDRFYYMLSWLRDRMKRNHISSQEQLAAWLAELGTPRWRLFPTYIRNWPVLLHTVTSNDDCWYGVITCAMVKANLTILNVTHIAESEGLLKEFKTAVHLMDTDKIAHDRVAFVCDYSQVNEVKPVIDRHSSRYEVTLIPVGGPGNQDEEWRQLFTRAAAS